MTPWRLTPGMSAAVRTRGDARLGAWPSGDVAKLEAGMMMGRADGARQQRVGRMSVGAEDLAAVDLALAVKPRDARAHRGPGLRRDRQLRPRHVRRRSTAAMILR